MIVRYKCVLRKRHNLTPSYLESESQESCLLYLKTFDTELIFARKTMAEVLLVLNLVTFFMVKWDAVFLMFKSYTGKPYGPNKTPWFPYFWTKKTVKSDIDIR